MHFDLRHGNIYELQTKYSTSNLIPKWGIERVERKFLIIIKVTASGAEKLSLQ